VIRHEEDRRLLPPPRRLQLGEDRRQLSVDALERGERLRRARPEGVLGLVELEEVHREEVRLLARKAHRHLRAQIVFHV
jgi:hypothetical protein